MLTCKVSSLLPFFFALHDCRGPVLPGIMAAATEVLFTVISIDSLVQTPYLTVQSEIVVGDHDCIRIIMLLYQ